MADGSSSELSAGGPEELEIRVKTLSQDEYTLRVPPQMPISALKVELQQRSSMPVDRQRLIYRGRVLANDSTLAATGVQDGHTIHLVERPADAPPPSSQATQESNPAARPQHRVAMGAINLPLDGSASVNALPDVMNQMLSQMLASMGVPPPQAQPSSATRVQQGAQHQQTGLGAAQPPNPGSAPAPATQHSHQPPGSEAATPEGLPDIAQVLSTLLTGLNAPMAGQTSAAGVQPGDGRQASAGAPPVEVPTGQPRQQANHRVRVQAGRVTGQGGTARPNHLLLALNQFITALENAASGTPTAREQQQWPHPGIHSHPAMQRLSIGMDSMPHQLSQILRTVLDSAPDLPQHLQDTLNSLPQRPTPQQARSEAQPPSSHPAGASTTPGAGDNAAQAGQPTGSNTAQLQPPSDSMLAIVCAAVAQLIRRFAAFIEQYGLPQMQQAVEGLLRSMSRDHLQSLNLQGLSAALASMGCMLLELGRLVTYLNDYSQGIVAPMVTAPPQYIQHPVSTPGMRRVGPHMRVSVQQRAAPRTHQPPQRNSGSSGPAASPPVAQAAHVSHAAPSQHGLSMTTPSRPTDTQAPPSTTQSGNMTPGQHIPEDTAPNTSVLPAASIGQRTSAAQRGGEPDGSASLTSHPLPSSDFTAASEGASAPALGTTRSSGSTSQGRGLGSGLPARAGLGAGLPTRGRGTRSGVARQPPRPSQPAATSSQFGPQTIMPSAGSGGGGADMASMMMSMLNGPGGEGLVQMASQLAQSPAIQRIAEQVMGPEDGTADGHNDETMTQPLDRAPQQTDFGQLMSNMMPLVQTMLGQSNPAAQPADTSHTESRIMMDNMAENISGDAAPPVPDFGQLLTSMMPVMQNMFGQMAGPPGIDSMQSQAPVSLHRPASHTSAPTSEPPRETAWNPDLSSWRAHLSDEEMHHWEATIRSDLAAIARQDAEQDQVTLSDAYQAGIRDPRPSASSTLL